MQYTYRTMDGRRSIDRKVETLVAYVNRHIGEMGDSVISETAEDWARRTIEEGIRRIAADCVAIRVA